MRDFIGNCYEWLAQPHGIDGIRSIYRRRTTGPDALGWISRGRLRVAIIIDDDVSEGAKSRDLAFERVFSESKTEFDNKNLS